MEGRVIAGRYRLARSLGGDLVCRTPDVRLTDDDDAGGPGTAFRLELPGRLAAARPPQPVASTLFGS